MLNTVKIIVLTSFVSASVTLGFIKIYNLIDPFDIQYHSQVGAERAIINCINESRCLTVDE